MCRFEQIIYNPLSHSFTNLHYIPEILKCYNKYSKYLRDDFTTDDGISYIYRSSPYLWAICDYSGNFMGFVSLDNFIGNSHTNFSAEITSGYERKAWGVFTRYSAKFFLKKCFDELGLYKITAQVFPDNFRVKTLLKSTGFKYTATLPSETLRNGKLQDIDVYSLYRYYYYKNEGENYD